MEFLFRTTSEDGSFMYPSIQVLAVPREHLAGSFTHNSTVINGDSNAKTGLRRTSEELHIGTYGLEWNEQGERLSEPIYHGEHDS
uniref:Transthyretin/hydroxyisourate hydrolase domain-containing protein n=1 Tax=Angiostrongylus cantonensis TaxID=6313 RepID=A0A0K0DDC5_ANGCA